MDFNFVTDTLIPTAGTNITISSTGSFSVPTGTTAQQPTAVNGMLRYDTDTNKLRAVQSGAWADVISAITALADPGGNGIVVRTALNTTINRTITGTASRLSVTNGDGVAGNPTLDISASYVGQATITTLGTITTGVWTGTDIAFANIAQGTARSVLGVTGNATADVASIQGTANQTLVVNAGGTALTFGTLAIAGGGTGQVTQTAGMDALSPTTTKGDLLVDNGTNVIRLAVGTNTQVLSANSATASGLEWVAAGGGGGAPTTAQYVVLALDGTLTAERVLTGTANQTVFTDGGANGNITLTIADNVVLPGTGSVSIPAGTTAQRTAADDDLFRYNTDEDIFEGAVGYPAGSFASYAGLQKSLMYRKRVWLTDEFIGTFPSTSDTDSYGQLGWHSVSNGTSANTTGGATADHIGIWGLVTGTTSGNDVRIHLAQSATGGSVMANQVEYFAFLIRIPTITTGSWKFGLGQDVSGVTQGTWGTDGVFFEFFPATVGTLQFYTRSGSVSSTPTATVTVAGNTWYLCEAFFDGTTWTPRVNGVNYTGIATNVPTTAVTVGAIVETLTTAARTLELDSFNLLSRELGNRY